MHLNNLYDLTPGTTKAVNALWGENPVAVQFSHTNPVVVADITGPGMITMIHFAYPQNHASSTQSISRDLLLLIYWDGSPPPSVEVPLVDFFCDPNGELDPVNTAFVNVHRGFNAYFPMPFRTEAKIVLEYDGTNKVGSSLESQMPCYSYVCYRSLDSFPENAGYFCASWKQQELLPGAGDYDALDATGQGKFIGMNLTVRSIYTNTYPADENVKFFVDDSTSTGVEFQELGDAFGFSLGFPSAGIQFPVTGFSTFHSNGIAAYRFFTQDAISFNSSLDMKIGFGATETGLMSQYSQPNSLFQFSSTVYWYQDQPNVAQPPMPPATNRAPAQMVFWPAGTGYASQDNFTTAGGKMLACCGLPGTELVDNFANSYSVTWDANSYEYSGWPGQVYFCRASSTNFSAQLSLPPGSRDGGLLRLYIIDPDNFQGGRQETIIVDGQTIGTFSNFQSGEWINVPVTAAQCASGVVVIKVVNARTTSNAVLSMIEWIDSPVNLTTQSVTSQNQNQLTFSWPLERTGWSLQSQTNSVSAGLGTNWFGVPGSTATNVFSVPLNTNGCVFYRLLYRGN
ncbi:MAG TPA: DUF2961 domain-containing protein [Verrucomicrobiae bacterium]|nr:DUF2961 domain-containing protein [Verrucomicrobiae bacterium]